MWAYKPVSALSCCFPLTIFEEEEAFAIEVIFVMDIDIIDSHLHVYDLALRSQFPNQNWSHSFPSEENESSIVYDVPQTLAKSVANESGVKKVVFVMCFDDCPEEAQWVYDNAQTTDLIIGIVAGLDLTKHEKLRHYIQKFRLEFKAPKFVGIRHHICFNEDLLFRWD